MVVIALFCVLASLVNPEFLSFGNIFDLLRNMIVPGVLALGVFVVLASGGIDVSFTAIAIFCGYATTKLLLYGGDESGLLLGLALAIAIGVTLGLFNAFWVVFFRLPTLIVTLATLSLFRGFMLTVIGTDYVTELPESLVAFSRWNLLSGTGTSGQTFRLPGAFLIFPGTAILTGLLLNRTVLGRGVFAVGGKHSAAARAGFPTRWIQCLVYGYVGALAGLAGLVHVSLARTANPFDLVGTELNVIAAVVLGGARITGGYGSVLGTLLGVVLIALIHGSLILVGVPSYWQKVVVGILIILGTAVTAYESRLEGSRSWSV